jgi:hypothetical protein
MTLFEIAEKRKLYEELDEEEARIYRFSTHWRHFQELKKIVYCAEHTIEEQKCIKLALLKGGDIQ